MPTNDSPTATVAAVINMFPAGTIIAYAGPATALPANWLLCDGSPFNQTTYPELYGVLNSSKVPDLRGYFLRGLDPTGTVDPGGPARVLLSVEKGAMQAHSHGYQAPALHWPSSQKDTTKYLYGNSVTDDAPDYETAVFGEKETRPVNVAVNYLIFAGVPKMQATQAHAVAVEEAV